MLTQKPQGLVYGLQLWLSNCGTGTTCGTLTLSSATQILSGLVLMESHIGPNIVLHVFLLSNLSLLLVLENGP